MSKTFQNLKISPPCMRLDSNLISIEYLSWVYAILNDSMSTMISIWHTQHPVKYSNESRMRFTCTTSSLSSFIALSPNCEWCMIITLLKHHSRRALERLSCEHNFLINMSNFLLLTIFRRSQPRGERLLQNYDDIFRMSCCSPKNPLQHNIFASAMSMNIFKRIWDSFQFKFVTSSKWKIVLLSSEWNYF